MRGWIKPKHNVLDVPSRSKWLCGGTWLCAPGLIIWSQCTPLRFNFRALGSAVHVIIMLGGGEWHNQHLREMFRFKLIINELRPGFNLVEGLRSGWNKKLFFLLICKYFKLCKMFWTNSDRPASISNIFCKLATQPTSTPTSLSWAAVRLFLWSAASQLSCFQPVKIPLWL